MKVASGMSPSFRDSLRFQSQMMVSLAQISSKWMCKLLRALWLIRMSVHITNVVNFTMITVMHNPFGSAQYLFFYIWTGSLKLCHCLNWIKFHFTLMLKLQYFIIDVFIMSLFKTVKCWIPYESTVVKLPTQAHWPVAVAKFLQNDITLLLVCFTTLSNRNV